jgi:hypothetical protein
VNAKDRSIIRFVAAMEDQKLIMVENCSGETFGYAIRLLVDGQALPYTL